MFDKDEKDCQCGNHEHGHDCDCENEECESNTITLDMEDGTQKDFMVLDIVEHEGKKYVALAEVDSMEYDILSMTVKDENVELNIIEDDEEFNLVATKFEELFAQDPNDDEDEEEE